MIKFSRTKLKYLTTSFMLLFFLGTIVGANTFAAQSFASIEQLEQNSATQKFTILEIVPKANSGSIGYYVADFEPGATVLSTETQYNNLVAELTAASLMATDGSAPLSPQEIFPWEAPASGAIEIALATEKDTEVVGTFLANSSGTGKFNQRSATPLTYEYVKTGGGFDFTSTATGATHTVYYDSFFVTDGIANNNWFKKYVFGNDQSNIDIEVISVTPNDPAIDTENELETLLQKVDLVVLSAGFDTTTKNSLETDYASNDLKLFQLDLLLGKDTPSATKPTHDGYFDPENEDMLAVVFDTKLVDLKLPVSPPATTSDNTNIAKLAEQLFDYSGKTKNSEVIIDGGTAKKIIDTGFVDRNIYAFTANPDGTSEKPDLATSEFNSPYQNPLVGIGVSSNPHYSPFYPVLKEIEDENDAREYDRTENSASWINLTTDVTIATCIRHIVDFALKDLEPIEIELYEDKDDTAEMKFYLMPFVFNALDTLAGSFITNSSLGDAWIKVDEQNEKYEDRQIKFYLYLLDNQNGDMYFDLTTNTMKELPSPVPNDLKDVDKFIQTDISGVDSNLFKHFNKSEPGRTFSDEPFEISLNSLINDFDELTDEYETKGYVEIRTKIGARYYSDFSSALTLQKLGLLSLG